MPRDLIGLDLGSATARAVRLQRTKHGHRLLDHAAVGRFDDLGQRKPLARVLTELDSRLPLRGRVVVAASDLATMVRFEHNDPMPPDRMERILRMELTQHAGDAPDLAADAVAVPVGGDELIHCCGLAQPDQVDQLLDELEAAKIRAANVDLAPAVLANALRYAAAPEAADADGGDTAAGEDEPTEAEAEQSATPSRGFELLVDIGARLTRVALVRDGEFLACRQLPIGGDHFTEELAKSRGLHFEEAERLKCGDGSEEITEGLPYKADPDDLIDVDPASLVGAPETADLGPIFEPGPTPDPARAEGDELQLEIGSESPVPSPAAVGPASPLEPGEPSSPAPGTPALDLSDEPTAGEPPPTPAWKRSEDGFALDEPELPAPGRQTRSLGGQQLGPELRRMAENLYAQIAKTVSWFQAQLRLRRIEVTRVRLAGGGSALHGLEAYFARRFGVPVQMLAPFAAMPDSDSMPAPAAPGYTLALGLALAGEAGTVSFNLMPERRQRRMLFWEQVVWPRVGAGLVGVATILAAVGLWRSEQVEAAKLELYRQHQQEHQRLVQEFERAENRRDGLLADLKSITSRIYGGRDMLYAVRALKELAPDVLWVTRMATYPEGRTTGVGGPPVIDGGGRGGRGRGGGRTGTGAGAVRTLPGTSEEVRTDTLITSVYVDGFLKPTAAVEGIDFYAIFNRWYDRVQHWSDPSVGARLYADAQAPIFNEVPGPDDEPTRYSFSIEFLFKETSWQEVATEVLQP